MIKTIHVVGLGMGAADMGQSALRIVEAADVLAGGRQQLDEFPQHRGERIELAGPLNHWLDRVIEAAKERRVVVVTSGDPNFFGVAARVLERAGSENVRIHPNVTTIQSAFARLKEPWHDAAVVSLHGRNLFALFEAIQERDKVAVYTDPENSPGRIARALIERGQIGWRMAVCEDLGRADAWRVYVDYRGEYLFGESALRSTLNLRLQPKADKFYLIGIVDDPVGKRTDKETTTTVHEGGTSYQRTVKQTTIDRDELKWNAQIGKRFYDVTARAGILASRGGFGIDYHMLNDRLKLTLEAYDFRVDSNPHLKFGVDYSFWKYFYLTGGVDDIMSQDDHATFFLGGGVTFYDDDLKFLLTSAPKP